MPFGFPLYMDLNGNNCTVFGGTEYAADAAETLLRFGAKVTVISPTLCPALKALDARQKIRYIPRKYYRSDCTSALLCVAATEEDTVNIAIATECKAKSIPVNVSSPRAFGNFAFPQAIILDDLQVSLVGDRPPEEMRKICQALETELHRLSE